MATATQPWDAERIERLRKRLTLTQEEFAGAVGVTLNAVWRWEHGGHPLAKHRRTMTKMEQEA
jgi:DNA-binding transcriptional regulator YiaG